MTSNLQSRTSLLTANKQPEQRVSVHLVRPDGEVLVAELPDIMITAPVNCYVSWHIVHSYYEFTTSNCRRGAGCGSRPPLESPTISAPKGASTCVEAENLLN